MYSGNPFSNNRAEYMKDLWKYYVPNIQVDFQSLQPMIIEGGRGTGKTTLFLCNCWREKYAKNLTEGGNGIKAVLDEKIIGIYYKVDPVFVSAIDRYSFEEKKIGVFNTYLSIKLLKEILAFLHCAENRGLISYEEVLSLSEKFYSSVWGTDRKDESIEELLKECDKVLDIIEDILNGRSYDNIRLSATGGVIRQVIEIVKNMRCFKAVSFKIYIDEFESLIDWQQKIINTFIKQSDNSLIFSVGVRPKGIKSFETLAPNEFLQKTHDYKYYCLDAIISDDYDQMLKDICHKRLQLYAEECGEVVNKISYKIEDYLGKYSIQTELERYQDKAHPHFYKRLHNIIVAETNDVQICNALCDAADPFHARLHLCILLRNKKYRPSVEELYKGYSDFKQDVLSIEAKEYKEWEHNAQNGVMFLLAKDYKVSKWYFGFDIFAALSSGIVRFFLELCEQAFSMALQKDFSWTDKKMIPPNIQTRAANYISRKQIMELDTYSVYGKQIHIFTSALGTLFKDLHRNDNTTLGEPEQNHFSINSLNSIDEKTMQGIDNAIRCSVLQELPLTKEKEVINTNTVDYHLNKIFAPFFEISCLRKRKIELDGNMLSDMLSSNNMLAEKAVKDYLRAYWKNKISDDTGNNIEQLSLFGLEGFNNDWR